VGTKSGRIFFGLIFLLVAACPALAQEAGKIMSIVGTAEVLRQERWQAVSLYEVLQAGEAVRTGPGSRMAVLLADGSQIKVNANSHLELKQVAPPVRKVGMEVLRTLLRLFSGEIWIRSYVEPVEIETLAATSTIRGTELNLAIEPAEATRLTVVEGVVEFRNPQGSVFVAAKEQAIAKPGEAPRKVIIIDPRDAVQWALYYPPLIDYRQVIYPEGPDAQAIRRALEHYRRGALPETLRSLEQVPPERRDARFFTLRAGLLLSVSQVAEARADIEEALQRNPSEATAYALRSIIALVQNQKKEALRLARQAVELKPQAPVPQVALSYAYQAAFDLEKALKSLEQAVRLAPEDALIHARLAELELSRGELERALKAARRAVALDPEFARTHTVLGFAYLTQIRIAQAKAAFERAITLDSTDPLPRLGLGLAKIRESNLAEGAREIEIAASLDPNNALIRSYLGKAYYEEKREKLAVREFATAKELDPQDPTSWFYDAIFKQTINRPVEALRDLQKSIELNDNRAVYRSKFLLDEDLAARGAALGRIYRDLGFEQLALVEGWKSVSMDPANHSSHRFLADSYAARSRHEIARVSELLQSQLLQPINITPIQPQLGESNLLLVEGLGPRGSSFNEFNPLFARNRLALQASGVVGTQDTYADEVVQSGLWGPLSYSVGQYHSETQGFRENNDLEQNIYTAFVQGAFTPNLSVQGEFRRRHTEHGDLELNADGTFDLFPRRQEDRDAYRLGIRYAPWSHSDFITSAIYFDGEEKQEDEFFERSSVSRGYNIEGQYLFHSPKVNAVLGGGYYDFDRDVASKSVFATQSSKSESTRRHGSGYVYTYLRYPAQITWTLGVSFDSFDDFDDQPSTNLEIGSLNKANWKLGLAWNLTPSTTLRLAAFRVLKRSLVVDQTIEPTQVAGFNQFFDDPNGTVSRRYGLALDHRFSLKVYGGIELSRRDLEVPVIGAGIKDRQEDLLKAYLYWTPHTNWVLKLEFEREDFDRREPFGEPPSNTNLVPFGIGYFDPSGFFARLVTTYVNQEVEVSEGEEKRNEFVLVDMSIGYRLPKRYGILSVGVKNLFDENFNFESFGLRTQQDESPPFVPERIVFGQITLAF
jgi:tetratricopeptide (TPR) repeat protein